jgi:hypothetical protein
MMGVAQHTHNFYIILIRMHTRVSHKMSTSVESWVIFLLKCLFRQKVLAAVTNLQLTVSLIVGIIEKRTIYILEKIGRGNEIFKTEIDCLVFRYLFRIELFT